ncbi:MAG: hypothetical protein WBD73_06860 [Candidatus Acidiferrales bacterium]
MSSEPLFAFDHKLSWDGLLTLLGGFLALFGIWWQVRHADEGLRKQLQAEKDGRAGERHERRRALSTAILFEIDRFYRYYVKNLLKDLESKPQGQPYPVLEAPGPAPFPVYATNCGQIGELDSVLAAAIVDFYTSAQRHALRICDYVEKCNAAQARGSGISSSLSSSIGSGGENLIPLAYIACAYLCAYAGIPFTTAKFDVARGEDMSEVTLDAAKTALAGFRARIGTPS